MIIKLSLLLFISSLFLGCSENKHTEYKPEPLYSSEVEKIINQSFLPLVGTDLYYKISEKDLEKAQQIDIEEGREKALTYYKSHRKEDTTKLVVFIRDNFINSSRSSPINLDEEMLSLINLTLKNNGFIKKENSSISILDSLSQPLKLSSINLSQTGRYQIYKEQNKEKVKGIYKNFGSFNTSKVYIDSTQNKATFFYEWNCMEGFKCAAGKMVILKKIKQQWIVTKQITLYQS